MSSRASKSCTVGNVIVTVTNPLSSAARYATQSQIVRVPEYTTLTLDPNTSLAPYPWDGTSGGIVAVFATGAIANAGAIQADGAGFRAGGLENANVRTWGARRFLTIMERCNAVWRGSQG